MPIHVPLASAKYVWFYGTDPETGKGGIAGPFKDEDAARSEAREMGFDNVRYWELPTRDRTRATGMIRGKVARTYGLRRAFQRNRRIKPGKQDEARPSEGQDIFDEESDED